MTKTTKQTITPTVATLGSHSALDVCRGAKDHGLSTLVIAEKGREKTYNQYYRSQGQLGCVDECFVVEKFADILTPKIQKELVKRNAIFVPNRSLEAYLNFNYQAIETKFQVPLFGNKFLLKIEERTAHPNQYDLLNQANIPYPKHFDDPRQIDRLCLVKMSEKARHFERAFFLVSSYEEFKEVSGRMIEEGKIETAELSSAVIEEFIIGVQVNFNFFYSVIHHRLELLGTDTRRQTNLDGLLRLPNSYQTAALEKVPVSYEEAGHIATTVLESLLEPAFAYGEAFVKASQKISPLGIIGPFALQTLITAGPPKKGIVVIDVSPRMPGSPGIAATPYGQYLWGKPISAGYRVAQELADAVQQQNIKGVTT